MILRPADSNRRSGVMLLMLARLLGEASRFHSKTNGGPLGWNSIVRLAVSARMLVEHCMAVGFLDKKPLPKLKSYLPEKIGKLIEQEKRPVDALHQRRPPPDAIEDPGRLRQELEALRTGR